jgi:pimeloyl-ACP methyl ester carboxylesterase
VVVGDYDWLTPPNAGRALASGIPGAELRVVRDAGHLAFGEQPELVAAAVPVGVGGI